MVIYIYLRTVFQPRCIIVLCLINFVFLVIFYALLLSYVDESVTLDDIVYQELLKIMDPNMRTVEQMTQSILNYTRKTAWPFIDIYCPMNLGSSKKSKRWRRRDWEKRG